MTRSPLKPLLSVHTPNYHSIDTSHSQIVASPSSLPDPGELPLPRPKLWPVFPLLAIADLAASLYTFLDRDPDQVVVINANRHLILGWTTLRAVVLAIAGSSRRVRSFGWVFAGAGMISIILLLWDTNEFVQRHQMDLPENRQSLRSYLLIVQLLLLFPILHWLAFLISVGVTNDRNPFVGNSLGFGSTTQAEYWNWSESVDRSALQRVVMLEEEEEDAQSSDDEPDDPDDIQDIPPRVTPLTPAPGSTSSRTRSLRARSRRDSLLADPDSFSRSRVPSSCSAVGRPLPPSSRSQIRGGATNAA